MPTSALAKRSQWADVGIGPYGGVTDIKIPPLNCIRGGIQIVFHGSTLVAVSIKPPLIDAITGAPGMAFPRIRLRSGIGGGRGAEPSHQTGSSLGIFPPPRVFITAFYR